MDPFMLIPGGITLLMLNQVGNMAGAVGKQRTKHKIKPPAVDGPAPFLNTFRAHQNTLEFLPMSLSLVWTGSYYAHPLAVLLPGLGYIYSRQKYFDGYCKDPSLRTGPFYNCVTCIKALLMVTVLGMGYHAGVGIFGFDAISFAKSLLGM